MKPLSFPKIHLPRLGLPFSKGRRLSVGLDIGSHSVKMCELAETPAGGYLLRSLGNSLVPAGAVEDGILQMPDEVAKVIAALAKNLKISSKKVAISISGYSVIVKKINLGIMPDQELEKHIYSEAEQYIPFDIDDVYLDFQSLHTNTSDEGRTDVMLVAAKRDVVDSYLRMVASTGLKTVVVDVDAFALENAFEANFEEEENIGLIDIGASKININIISGGTSVLTRDVVLGSRQLTEDIQNAFGIGFEEAEAIKLGAQPAEERSKEIEEIFGSACRQWAAEIRRALDFFYANNPETKLSKLILSGGGSKISGLPRFLQAELDLAVENFNPFARIVSDGSIISREYLAQVGPEMAIATGLATRPVAL